MPTLNVDLGTRSYNIEIGSGLLGQAGAMVRKVTATRKILLVSNPLVYGLYGNTCLESLQKNGFEVSIALMPDGEEYKTIDEAMKIIDTAVRDRIERSSMCVALGGGVVGDLAGFIAAIYQRGIDFVQIPTTLLAQVDSSVGGKVAVNHPQGKNLLGAFHQPELVLIDTDTLKTLDQRDYLSGLGEIIKYGLIYDEEFFSFIETEAHRIMQQEKSCLQKLIYRACQIKSEIVAEDETEQGKRVILNLGHTFGHAIEKLSDYKLYRHGEAVTMGVRAASHLASILGFMSDRDLIRVEELFARLGINTRLPSYRFEDIIFAMQGDKKVKDNRINFVLPNGIGNYVITDMVTNQQVQAAIQAAQE